jgi:hypothetical protein
MMLTFVPRPPLSGLIECELVVVLSGARSGPIFCGAQSESFVIETASELHERLQAAATATARFRVLEATSPSRSASVRAGSSRSSRRRSASRRSCTAACVAFQDVLARVRAGARERGHVALEE